jgi:hypothetical protein
MNTRTNRPSLSEALSRVILLRLSEKNDPISVFQAMAITDRSHTVCHSALRLMEAKGLLRCITGSHPYRYELTPAGQQAAQEVQKSNGPNDVATPVVYDAASVWVGDESIPTPITATEGPEILTAALAEREDA